MSISNVIHQTWETVFHRDTVRRAENTTSSGVFFFYEIQAVWIADETLSRMFDISPESKQKLRSKGRSKIVKIYC